MKKILIINPFGIGDVLFTTPVIRAIKENYPDAFLGYWCNERVKPILENNPFVDKIFALSRGDLKKIWQKSKIEGVKAFLELKRAIKKERFDIAIDFSLDHRYGLMAKILGIKRRIGFNYKDRGRFLTEKIDIQGYNEKHMVDYYLDILDFLDIPRPKNPQIELFISKEEKSWAERFLKDYDISDKNLLVGVCPAGGASWGKNAIYLQWPEEKFAGLCSLLIEKDNLKIILFGSPEEEKICKNIESSIKDDKKRNLINTAGELTIRQFISLLQRCKIAICNDAGPLHMAVSLGLKVVCISGPVNEKVYGPYPLNNHIVIKKDLQCRPCYKNFRFSGCEYNLSCLRDITVEEVYFAVKSLLK